MRGRWDLSPRARDRDRRTHAVYFCLHPVSTQPYPQASCPRPSHQRFPTARFYLPLVRTCPPFLVVTGCLSCSNLLPALATVRVHISRPWCVLSLGLEYSRPFSLPPMPLTLLTSLTPSPSSQRLPGATEEASTFLLCSTSHSMWRRSFCFHQG